MSGRKSQRAGSGFENVVLSCLAQIPVQIAQVEQRGPLFQLQKFLPGGKAIGYLKSRGGLDFEGDIHGRRILFDAKSCAEATRFPLANLETHQVDALRKAHGRGAIAFFLIEMAGCKPPRYFVLPWPVLEPIWIKRITGLKGSRPGSIPLATLEGECMELQPSPLGFLDLGALFRELHYGGFKR